MFKRKNKHMVTTDNEISNQPIERREKVAKDDVAKLKAEYVKGATIDDLADEYGYTPLAVNQAVVDEVPAPEELKTQAEIDASPQPAPAKKAK